MASISTSGKEFFNAGAFGTFSSFRQKVQIAVGSFDPFDSTQVTLSLFDVNGGLVAQPVTAAVNGGASPAILSVTAPGPTPNVAYFLVQSADQNKNLWIDDVTFDNPAIAAAPDFAFNVLGVGGNVIYVTQGISATAPLPIQRFNGSDGSIALSASGLSQGVIATFAPNPLAGTSALTQMTLSVQPDAQLVTAAPFTVTGVPASNAVAPGPRSVQLQVTVAPPMTIQTLGLGSILPLAPCTPLTISPIYVNKDPAAVLSDVTLSLRVSQGNGGTGDLPAGIHATFNPPVAPQGSQLTIHTLMITLDPGVLEWWQHLDLVVEGTSSTLTVLSQPFTLNGDSDEIDSVSPPSGFIPKLITGQHGPQVFIVGKGFCPGSQVEFGNDLSGSARTSTTMSGLALVDPDSLTPTEVRATVPLLATEGPPLAISTISLVEPGGRRLTTVPRTTFPVDSYRNTNGYSFHNYIPHTTFGQLTEAYGSSQTEDSINPCWPWVDCSISWPDLGAEIWLNLLKSFTDTQGGGGACFGIALSAQRFLAQQRALSDFPPTGASDAFDLDGRNGPSAPLTDYINSQDTVQLSSEYLDDYLGQSVSNSTGHTSAVLLNIHHVIHDALTMGEAPLIALRWGGQGHLVTAYDIEDVSSNPIEYWIDVYDPNLQFTTIDGHDSNGQFRAGEDSDGSGVTHKSSVQASRIHIAADGTWSLKSTNASGFINGLIVTPASGIPVNPTLPGSLAAQVLSTGQVTLFGTLGGTGAGGQSIASPASRTTQLADTRGHTLFGADGKLNPDPASRLNATPFAPFNPTASPGEMFVVAPSSGALVQSVTGLRSGADIHVITAAGMNARISTEAAVGVTDQIGFDPAGTISFGTHGTLKPFSIGLMTRTDGMVRSAEISTTSSRGALEEMGFNDTRTGVIVRHDGPAAPLRLRLSGLATKGGVVTFDSGPLEIGAGAIATFTSSNWERLDSVLMTLRYLGGNERRTFLQNRFASRSLARIARLDIDTVPRRPRSRSLEVISRLQDLPLDSKVVITWIVRDRGHIVGHEARKLPESNVHPGERRDRFIFSSSDGGHYDVTATVGVYITEGMIQTAQTNSKAASFDVRR